MYASRSRCESPSLSTLATSGVPSSSSALYTSPMQPPPRGRAESIRSPRCASTPSATIFSATFRQVPVADVFQESFGCLFYQIENVLETIGAAAVGVGDLAFRGMWGEVEKGPDHRMAAAQRGDRPVVLLVHREDVVKRLAVVRRDLAGPLGAQVETAGESAPLGTAVRRASDVPGAGTRGVYEDFVIQLLAPQHVLEDPLSQRRTADISQANEQDAYHLYVIYHRGGKGVARFEEVHDKVAREGEHRGPAESGEAKRRAFPGLREQTAEKTG